MDTSTTTAFLIYLAMISCLTAFMLGLLRKNKLAAAFFIIGFLWNLLAIVFRWIHVHHVPMQSLYEIFLWLGALVYPSSYFCRRYLHADSAAFDALIAVILLFPAAFIFPSTPEHLPPALNCWLFVPHVTAYILAYIFMLKAALCAAQLLLGHHSQPAAMQIEQTAYQLAAIGFPLLTLGLVLGCFWGKLAWGDYWNWDPKELWSLASWLAYLIYFHFRSFDNRRHPRLNALILIMAALVIVVTLVWVNLSKLFLGLHNYA